MLNEKTDAEKELEDILKSAEQLHEDLRTYGNVQEESKPLIVSGILLALHEVANGNFNLDSLTGDSMKTDGSKIYDAIEANLERVGVKPEEKKKLMLNQFQVIRDNKHLSAINETLGKTPLKHYTVFLQNHVYNHVKNTNSAEDVLGRFYGEFVSYSGGDGNSLGIVLTPKHVTEIFCELVDMQKDDVVLDPCCGTGGFLIASMYKMLSLAENDEEVASIKANQLHGVELQSNLFTVAATNMILRGDGKSNIQQNDFLTCDPKVLQEQKQATVGLINPPYSLAKKTNIKEKAEIYFLERLLDSLKPGGRCAAIIPPAVMTGTQSYEKVVKKNILKHHTLEGVITMNKDTFHGAAGTGACIAVFTAGKPHPANKRAKFINFTDDGYEVKMHIGRLPTERAKERKQLLLDVWFDRVDADTSFCVETTVEATDEWIHAFYYFNDETPKHEEIEESVKSFMEFEFSMVLRGNSSFFNNETIEHEDLLPLNEKEWKPVKLVDIFDTFTSGKCKSASALRSGSIPYIGATNNNNGVLKFVAPQKKEDISEGNFIGFIGNGDGSAGLSVYKEEPCVVSTSVICGYSQHLNKYVGLFLSACIDLSVYTDKNHTHRKYGHALSRSHARLLKDSIVLPFDEAGNIDWGYMEQYVKNSMIDLHDRYMGYLAQFDHSSSASDAE